MVKLNIKNNPEKVKDLVKLLKLVAKEEKGGAARAAIAAFIGPVITQVLQQKATHRAMYSQYSYNFGEAPTIPLDAFETNEEGLLDIWSTSIPGGLATNHIYGGDEFRMTTFPYDSALSILKRDAEKGRFEILVKGMERFSQEIMAKEKFQAWGTILRALGAARTNGAAHVIDATTSGVFQIHDTNKLKTKISRLRNSWLGGTPTDTVGSGITHLVVSPEIMEQVRAWAYEPANTRSGAVTTSGATAIPLPEQIRSSIYNTAGLTSIPGVGEFIELREFGVGQAYNAIFDSGYTSSGSDPTFNSASQELILGIDLSLDAGVQMTATDSDRTSELQVQEDDQFTARSGRIGWFGGLETGFAWMDNKALTGIIV